jgi:hypothetical protein
VTRSTLSTPTRMAMTLLLGLAFTACSAPGSLSESTRPAATDEDNSPLPESLCEAIPEALGEAALGTAVGAPQGGDVVPRPNGIYCRYSAADDANVNVEAQLKEMTRAEFDALATTLGMTEAVSGVGEVAYKLDHSLMGGAGVAVAAFAAGRGVTVALNGEGDADAQLAGAIAIAKAALAS